MADNTIEGRAKKFDGTAIDYVSIFNWADGKCIAQITPDAAGNWSYGYTQNLNVGLTYVADGCEPITHGAYDFAYQAPALPIPTDTFLHYAFNGDALDGSAGNRDGEIKGSTNFTVGRKAGTQALEFTNGYVQSPYLPFDSDKFTISLHLKTNQTDMGLIYEITPSVEIFANAIGLILNDPQQGFIGAKTLNKKGSPNSYNFAKSSVSLDDVWQHVIVECDRARAGVDEYKIYINNVLTSTYVDANDGSGKISSDTMYIGKRGGYNTLPFKGVIQDFRVYRRILTDDERTALYNE